MTSLRCSSLPLFMKCAPSMRGEMDIKEWFPEAELGTAVHDALAREVRGQPVDLSAIASLYGVDQDEMGPLVVAGRRAWAELAPRRGTAEAEVSMTTKILDEPSRLELILSGTADVVILEPPSAVTIIDWKTGRRDTDYREQVLGYCALALAAVPDVDIALAKLVWLRTNEVEAYSLTRANLQAWASRLGDQEDDAAFHPGAHCQYCPRKFSCPAREEMSRSAIAILGDGSVRTLRGLPVEQQVALYRQAKVVQGLAFDVLGEVRNLVSELGPITALGVRLEVVEEPRRNCHTTAAWPVLQKYLTDKQLADVVTVSLSKAEDAAGEGLPRGDKGARRREMLAELEAAGAVGHTTIKKLTERRG